ncbi:PilZ domain-containing protein [Sedimenticola sp.]|uniref:PilZ domain-containing protein n=1 Tax=Sedimenticola sp. TaxID=1940285 RepID=UPI003D0DFC85
MPEKRSHPRKSCDTRIDILDAESKKLIGTLVNLSVSGFMMISEQSLPENYVFQFDVVFAPGATDSITLQIGAESLWIQEVEGSNQRWIGFHIIDISEQDRATINRLISNWRD